jgi:hypothetical protein
VCVSWPCLWSLPVLSNQNRHTNTPLCPLPPPPPPIVAPPRPTVRCGPQVLAPYDCEDARGLLKAAIRDPDPVVFLENEILYGQSFPVDDKVWGGAGCVGGGGGVHLGCWEEWRSATQRGRGAAAGHSTLYAGVPRGCGKRAIAAGFALVDMMLPTVSDAGSQPVHVATVPSGPIECTHLSLVLVSLCSSVLHFLLPTCPFPCFPSCYSTSCPAPPPTDPGQGLCAAHRQGQGDAPGQGHHGHRLQQDGGREPGRRGAAGSRGHRRGGEGR